MCDEELFYYANQINRQAWRFSFGRMVQKDRIRILPISRPLDKNNEYDKPYIKRLVSSCYGFNELVKLN